MLEYLGVGLIVLLSALLAYRRWLMRKVRDAFSQDGKHLRLVMSEEAYQRASQRYNLVHNANLAGYLLNHVQTCELPESECTVCQELAQEGRASQEGEAP